MSAAAAMATEGAAAPSPAPAVAPTMAGPTGRWVVLCWHRPRMSDPWIVERGHAGEAWAVFPRAADLRADPMRRDVRVVREEEAGAIQAAMLRRGGPA